MSLQSQLPFQKINPLKFVGINKSNAFCSIVCQGRLIYTSGANIIMENTKTNQQRILFNNTYPGKIQLIRHHITLYNQHILAIVIKDMVNLMHIIEIISLNRLIFNSTEKKDKDFNHPLKSIEEFEVVQQIQFFQDGSLFGIISKYEKINNFTIYRTSNGQILLRQTYVDSNILLGSIILNKLNCASILHHEKGQIKLCLMAVDQLSRRFYFRISLSEQQIIIDHYFQCYQEYNILIALTSLGFVLIYKVNQYEIVELNKIDVKDVRSRKEGADMKQSTFNPFAIQPCKNKIIIAYEGTSLIGVLFYSSLNSKNTKFSVIEDAFTKYPYLKGISSIKIAKDNCSLAVLAEVYAQRMEIKIEQQPLSNNQISLKTSNLSNRYHLQDTILPLHKQSKENKQYIVLQVDILSNMIDHQQHSLSVSQTFSVYACHKKVDKIEYCSNNNTMFVLLENKMLKFYDLNPKIQESKFKNNISHYLDFNRESLLYWQQLLKYKPISLTTHPFNFTILLIYQQILKFHYYNTKSLLPAFLVTNVKDCRLARYSPFGDKLILATNGSVTIMNSYTFQVYKTIGLPNILTQAQINRTNKFGKKNIENSNLSKSVTNIIFMSNQDFLLFSGNNTFSSVVNHEKSFHFGFLENIEKCTSLCIIYDHVNNLTIMAQNQALLVLDKCNINTKNKCEIVSKIEVNASSLFLLPEIGILFVGGRNGVIHMLKWPDYSQEDLYLKSTNKFFLFNEPIINISVTQNLKYLYAISQSGNFCISELVVNIQSKDLSRAIKERLLKCSQISLGENDRWLLSYSQQEKKERQIIKLRGKEVDLHNLHNTFDKEQENIHSEMLQVQKKQLEEEYNQKIKRYQEDLGLQKLLQDISMLKDQLKLIHKVKERGLEEVKKDHEENLKKIFFEKTNLEKQYKQVQVQCQKYIEDIILSNRVKINEKEVNCSHHCEKSCCDHESVLEDMGKNSTNIKIKAANIQQQHFQDLQLLNQQFHQEYKQTSEANQEILSKNRSINISIHNITDKMEYINISKESLEYDLFKIINEREQLEKIKERVMAENQLNKKLEDMLIKKSKQLEDKLIHERKLKVQFENTIKKLNEELNQYIDYQGRLEKQKTELNRNYIDAQEQSERKSRDLSALTCKLQSLKQMKKQKHYLNCFLKGNYQQAVKNIMRNLQIDEVEAVKNIKQQNKKQPIQQKEQSHLNTEFEFLKLQHEKISNDSMKWNEIKDAYMASFFKNHKKLNEQNLKLTYRYNDFLRLSQEYKNRIHDIKEHIDKLNRIQVKHKTLSKTINFYSPSQQTQTGSSFYAKDKIPSKQNIFKKSIKKKAICISLHQSTGKFITQA